jgi:hypothetical protein
MDKFDPFPEYVKEKVGEAIFQTMELVEKAMAEHGISYAELGPISNNCQYCILNSSACSSSLVPDDKRIMPCHSYGAYLEDVMIAVSAMLDAHS